MVVKKEINVNFKRDRSSSKQFRFNPNCDNVVTEAQNYCHFIDRLISYHALTMSIMSEGLTPSNGGNLVDVMH